MRPHVIMRYNGLVLLFNAAFMLIAFSISLYHNDSGIQPLLLSTIITTLFGIFPLVFVPKTIELSSKESYLIVITSWLLSCLFGMLPFLLYGHEFNFINAWFESVSGYTTTGATILSNVEAMPKGILFWRSSTHWIGGIGVVLFVLIVIPSIGKARMALSRVEISPLAKGTFQSRTRDILYIILIVYIGLTLAETILLMLAGMSPYDAVNHAFATIATGGFSTKNNSIAHFNSTSINLIITVFMLLAGVHFGLLFNTLLLRKKHFFNSAIVKYYFISIAIGATIIAVDLWGKSYHRLDDSFIHSLFQVASVASTTGFATADTAVWPSLSIFILIFFSFQCACSGSTGGGIKVDRVYIFFKSLRYQIVKLQHPNAIVSVKVDKYSIENHTLTAILLFIVLYAFIVLIGSILIAVTGEDMMTAFSASLAAMSNVGPGFGKVGSMSNYFEVSTFTKMILSVEMLLGRLEIYGLALLFMFKWWK